jgi:hypothetical protein
LGSVILGLRGLKSGGAHGGALFAVGVMMAREEWKIAEREHTTGRLRARNGVNKFIN